MTPAARTAVRFYIDGFNLYHALLMFKDDKVKWLDLELLCHRIIAPRTEVVDKIYYFSAYADWLPDPVSRHKEYVKALEARGIACVMGHFKKKDRQCFECGSKWVAHEEKETDVSIGITLVNDAHRGRFERAYLVTRDSDLTPAVKMVRSEFPDKEIVTVAPPFLAHSQDLLKVCNSKKKINAAQVRACLFPKKVLSPDGTVAAKIRLTVHRWQAALCQPTLMAAPYPSAAG
jgi:uncharacterized LabA/DUF88 family protein